MRRYIIALLCVLGTFISTTAFWQDTAKDEKPPITNPTSIEESI